jgi:hypothetical protein
MRALTLFKQSRARRRLVLEACRELLSAWWLVRFREFCIYAGVLGEAHPASFTTEFTRDDARLLRDMRCAIDAIRRQADCAILGVLCLARSRWNAGTAIPT